MDVHRRRRVHARAQGHRSRRCIEHGDDHGHRRQQLSGDHARRAVTRSRVVRRRHDCVLGSCVRRTRRRPSGDGALVVTRARALLVIGLSRPRLGELSRDRIGQLRDTRSRVPLAPAAGRDRDRLERSLIERDRHPPAEDVRCHVRVQSIRHRALGREARRIRRPSRDRSSPTAKRPSPRPRRSSAMQSPTTSCPGPTVARAATSSRSIRRAPTPRRTNRDERAVPRARRARPNVAAQRRSHSRRCHTEFSLVLFGVCLSVHGAGKRIELGRRPDRDEHLAGLDRRVR